jgi:hypothetical protein
VVVEHVRKLREHANNFQALNAQEHLKLNFLQIPTDNFMNFIKNQNIAILLILFSISLSLTATAQPRKPKSSDASTYKKLTRKQQTAISSLEKIASDYTISLDETNFQDVPRNVKVVCSSIFVLWDYQPSLEKERLVKLIKYIKNSFVENFNDEKDSRIYLKQAIRYAIGEMAKKDKKEALKLSKEFAETELSLASNLNNDEKLELAEDLLEIDVSKSVIIAESVLKVSIPQRAIGYLSKLKEVSTPSHDYLFRKILVLLSTGVIYDIKQELILQSYIFKETYTAYPVTEQSDIPGFDIHEFPVGGVEINEKEVFRNLKVTADEVKLYFTSSISGYKKKLTQIANSNGFQSAQYYFWVCKLNTSQEFYSDFVSQFAAEIKSIQSDAESLALSKGVTAQNIEHLKFIATTVVLNQFGEIIGDISEDNVTEKTDDFTKTRILEGKILKNIYKKDFLEAENLIFEIKDLKTNQVLIDNLNYSIIADSSQNNKPIDDIEERLKKISDLKVKVLTLFEISHSNIKSNKRESAKDSLFLARQIISNQLESNEKPQMIVGLLSLQSKIEKKSNFEILSEVNRIVTNRNLINYEESNRSNIYCLAYKGGSIKLYSQGVVDGGIQYDFSGSSIEDAYESSARTNWEEALEYSESIENKFLRSRAVLSVCKLALLPKTITK